VNEHSIYFFFCDFVRDLLFVDTNFYYFLYIKMSSRKIKRLYHLYLDTTPLYVEFLDRN